LQLANPRVQRPADHPRLDELGPVVMKGISEPVRLFRASYPEGDE